MQPISPFILTLLLPLYLGFYLPVAFSDDHFEDVSDLTDIGLSDLMNLDMEVTTATRRSQQVSETASALYVITRDDIVRSGARHVAEALRLAPGVEVARINGNTWAVSIRGFNQRFSHQILVLVDGRTVFTPWILGTIWETLDVSVENIERIEVIRGPGASVWGSNAANGVVNIITRKATPEDGSRVKIGGGSHERYFHYVANSGSLNSKVAYRVSTEQAIRASNTLPEGGDAQDDWSFSVAELRFDSTDEAKDDYSLILNTHYQEEYLPVSVPSFEAPFIDSTSFSRNNYNSGASLSGRYATDISERESLKFKADYIFERRNSLILPIERHSLALEALHINSLASGWEFTSGIGYQLYLDDTEPNFAESLIPADRDAHMYTSFLQVQRKLFEDKLHLLAGTKLEFNDFSGLEIMPTMRAVYTPSHTTSIWLGFARATSTPGRVFDDTFIPLQTIPGGAGEPPAVVIAEGSSDVESTNLNSYEIGVRQQFSSRVFADLSLFYFDFNDVIGIQSGDPRLGVLPFREDLGTLPLIPLRFGNSYKATARGAELTVEWAISHSLSVTSFYSFLDLGVSQGDGSIDSEEQLKEGNSPEHSAGIRMRVDLGESFRVDPRVRYVDSLKFGDIPGYWELDLRLAWSPVENMEISVAGHDLLNDSHKENIGTLFSPPPTEIERSVWGAVEYVF